MFRRSHDKPDGDGGTDTARDLVGAAPGLAHRVATGLLRRFTSARVQTFDLATTGIAGPVQFTAGGVFVWFVLGSQSWDFLTLTERRRVWDQQTYRWGRLAEASPEPGRPLRIRVTTKPYPSFEFARSLDEATPAPLPQVEGGESWDDYLAHAQRRLRNTGLDTKMTAVGVWIGPPASPRVRTELVDGTDTPSKETAGLVEQLRQVEQIMAGHGLNGRLATGSEMAFLFHRSLSMGIPAPVHAGAGGERWQPSDLAEFTDRRAWLAEPYGPTVHIISETGAARSERFVAVLSMGVMPDRHWPENGQDPWMLSTSRLSFPVEWSLAGVLLKAATVAPAAVFEHNRAEGIADHYAEHHLTPPPAVARAIAGAVVNADQVTTGDARTAARWSGTIRLAVYGRSEEQALRRARDVIDHYGERLRMPLTRTADQVGALREFIPGEPRIRHGWQRRLPVGYLASGMPNVDSELGTPTGPYFGYGIGSARRAARFDLHYGPERLNAPGLFTITAEPGGGKSVLIGALAYNAARCGEHTIIFDPSGPLTKLAELPELSPYARVLDLTTSAPGTLSPYQLIPDPTTAAFYPDTDHSGEDARKSGGWDEVGYRRAVRRARAERQQLMFDVLRMWLPPALLRAAGVDVVLREAIRQVSTQAEADHFQDVQINPRWILNHILDQADTAETAQQRELCRQIAAEVTTAAEFPLGELIMPSHDDWIRPDTTTDRPLVIVTMPGLNPPPEGVEREFWGSEERYTQPLLHLAAFFASKFIYGRARGERKNVFLDENHLMSQWGSGRAFFVRLSRDSRKWNTAIGAASQHPDDHLTIGRVNALTGGAFVGRLTDHDTATAACQLLQAPVEYAPVIQQLSPKPAPGQTADQVDGQGSGGETGEFVWRDPLGRLGKIRIDMDWHPSLRAALSTTPGRPRPAGRLEVQPAPFIDPDIFDHITPIPNTDSDDSGEPDGTDAEGAAS